MKNILLATTGLFGAALLATAASAAGPKVTVGGFTDFQAGFVSDDFDANTRKQAFRNDTEISVRVDGKTDAGLGYGAVIDLEADVTNDVNNQGTNAARTFTYLDGSWGKVEMGSNKGAAATQRVDASTLASATGGINGAWVFQPNLSAFGGVPAGSLGASGGFITTSKLASEHGSLTVLGDEATYNSNKITYYSPRFSGFQVGASYTPKLGARGQTMNRQDNAGNFGDVIEAGINFEHEFDGGIKLAASLTGENGDNDNAAVEDLNAYAIGALIGYQGFSLAASYSDWSDSGQATGSGNDQDVWTLGGAYDAGLWSVSATYLNSTVEQGVNDNDFDNIVIGADYKLAPGITPYAEVSFYEFDQGGAGGFDNDGTAVILGTQVAF